MAPVSDFSIVSWILLLQDLLSKRRIPTHIRIIRTQWFATSSSCTETSSMASAQGQGAPKTQTYQWWTSRDNRHQNTKTRNNPQHLRKDSNMSVFASEFMQRMASPLLHWMIRAFWCRSHFRAQDSSSNRSLPVILVFDCASLHQFCISLAFKAHCLEEHEHQAVAQRWDVGTPSGAEDLTRLHMQHPEIKFNRM